MSWDHDEFTKKRKEWEEKQKKLALERKKEQEELQLKKEKRKLEEKKKAKQQLVREERQKSANAEMERLMGEAFAGGSSEKEQKGSVSLAMGTVFGGSGGASERRGARGDGTRKVPPGAFIPGLDEARVEKDKRKSLVNMSGGGSRYLGSDGAKPSSTARGVGGGSVLKRF